MQMKDLLNRAYHDPQSFAGRIEIVFAHPITVARAYGRKFFRHAAQ